MKIIYLTMMAILFLSCGKKSSESEISVSTTPAISVDDNPDENTQVNQLFSVTANKFQYELDDVILLEIKNLGTGVLNHLDFYFTADTQELIVSRINCFKELNYRDICSFIIRFKSPQEGYHKLDVIYGDTVLTLTVELKGGNPPVPVDFLYQNNHTFADCYKASKLGKNGFVKFVNQNNFCSFRAAHWNLDEKTQIENDPLYPMIDTHSDANAFYCPDGWTINSFEFAQSIVVEHTNFWGGRKEVTIPAGEHREICVARNLLGCKERKTFYSRLIKVNCY